MGRAVLTDGDLEVLDLVQIFDDPDGAEVLFQGRSDEAWELRNAVCNRRGCDFLREEAWMLRRALAEPLLLGMPGLSRSSIA